VIGAVLLTLSFSLMPPVRPQLPPAKPLCLPIPSVSAVADPWLGQDKVRHFTVSLLMSGMLAYTARHQWRMHPAEARMTGMGGALSIGIVKEFWDSKTSGHTASLRDLAADLAGVLLGGWLLSW